MSRPIGFEWSRGDLGAKIDECAACGSIGRHELARDIRWFHLGPIPLIPCGLRHGLACSTCGAFTRISSRRLRSATKQRQLALPDRPRPRLASGAAVGVDVDSVSPRKGLDGGIWKLIVWAIVVVVAFGVGVQTLPTETAQYRPGFGEPTCLSEAGATAGQPLPSGPAEFVLKTVPCAGPHNFEVLAETNAPQSLFDTFPPNADYGQQVHDACEAAYVKVFGHPSSQGPVQLVAFGPDPIDWPKGDRKVQCTAYDPAHPWMHGSYQQGTSGPVVTGD